MALLSPLTLAICIAFALFFSSALAQNTSETDFLIVGAGTSGCVLASRLCVAFPNLKITLLERGEPRSPDSQFLHGAPRNLYRLWSDRAVTQFYDSVPDAAINNRTTAILTGTTLGGSSSINGMQWTVPLTGTVEKWGIRGLNTEVANKFFRTAYDKVGFAEPSHPLEYADDYVRAGLRAGFDPSDDPITQTPTSVWKNRVAIGPQFRRRDSCTAYLTPVQSNACRTNLDVVQGVTASSIRMENFGNKKVAVGVDTISTSDRQTKRSFTARREVIIASGPYESPKLLQLSGIGPREMLQNLGINVQIDLPVGQATVGRPSAGIVSTFNGVPDEPANNETAINSAEARAQWESGQGGILATPVTAANGRTGADGYFTTSIIPFFPGTPELRTGCYINTETRGYVRLRDADAFSPPLVKQDLMGSPSDFTKMRRCLVSIAKIHRNFPNNFNMTFTLPADEVFSDKFLRETTNTGAHFVGGCPVGDVLEPNLMVKGTTQLRVVDSSSMRSIPQSAGPAASVYMLAEFMSDQIIKTHQDVRSGFGGSGASSRAGRVGGSFIVGGAGGRGAFSQKSLGARLKAWGVYKYWKDC